MNPKHIIGKVCLKHPELGGERHGKGQHHCIACIREQNSKWRNENIEVVKARDKAYAKTNRPRLAALQRQWYLKNKPKVLATVKDWTKRNKERKAAANAAWSKNNWRKFSASIQTNCVIRRRIIGGQVIARTYAKQTADIYKHCPPGHQVDHIMPLRGETVNGLHVPWNLQYLPTLENQRKHNKLPENM